MGVDARADSLSAYGRYFSAKIFEKVADVSCILQFYIKYIPRISRVLHPPSRGRLARRRYKPRKPRLWRTRTVRDKPLRQSFGHVKNVEDGCRFLGIARVMTKRPEISFHIRGNLQRFERWQLDSEKSPPTSHTPDKNHCGEQRY